MNPFEKKGPEIHFAKYGVAGEGRLHVDKYKRPCGRGEDVGQREGKSAGWKNGTSWSTGCVRCEIQARGIEARDSKRFSSFSSKNDNFQQE